MEKEQPIQPELLEKMRGLGIFINDFLNGEGTLRDENKKWAFALFVFPFGAGDDHRSNYISNGTRDDIIATLKEFIARVEGTYVEKGKTQQ